MRNLNGLKWLCALALISAAANADVIIDNQTILGADVQSISIGPASGNIFIVTTPGYIVKKSASTPGGVTVTLTASPLSINIGQSVTLTWSSTNATSCLSSGTWSAGKRRTTGSREVPPLSSAGKYTFILTCSNSTTGESNSGTVTVTVIDPSTNPVPSNCKAPSLRQTATSQNWDSLWGVAFPLPRLAVKRMDVGSSGYNYIKFNTGNTNGAGSFLLMETTTSPGLRRGALSECPGDFDVAPECKQTWGLSEFLSYSTNGTTGTCQLKKGTDYYFNVTFTDEQDTSKSKCRTTVGKCLVEIRTGFTEQ
ncbi:MAG: hypothetical protein GXP11_09580 [Gammaproteobacteria bacterium]|nr:hypothetical protein [Gammaproteobacteria bacterium]